MLGHFIMKPSSPPDDGFSFDFHLIFRFYWSIKVDITKYTTIESSKTAYIIKSTLTYGLYC
jgi:hypothetical protein